MTASKFDALGDPIPELLTRAEAARLLRISQRKLGEMKASGQLPYVQIGRLVRFDSRDLRKWIDGHRYLGVRLMREGE